MKWIIRFWIGFFAIAGAVALGAGVLPQLKEWLGIASIEWKYANYWDHHGLIFLVGLAFFPRISLLLTQALSGGLLWWLGFFFAPRVLVAALGTLTYWPENYVLVVIAWLVALSGESSEKYAVVRGGTRGGRGFKEARWVRSEVRSRRRD